MEGITIHYSDWPQVITRSFCLTFWWLQSSLTSNKIQVSLLTAQHKTRHSTSPGLVTSLIERLAHMTWFKVSVFQLFWTDGCQQSVFSARYSAHVTCTTFSFYYTRWASSLLVHLNMSLISDRSVALFCSHLPQFIDCLYPNNNAVCYWA